jgi:hypothetical protein
MSKRDSTGQLSRRQFARGVTLAALAASLPRKLTAQEPEAPTGAAPPKPATPSTERKEPQLSPAARAEAELKIQNLLRKYGDRLSAEQKAEVRKSLLQAQESLEKLRAFPLENWDEPAAVFRPLTGKEV